MVVRHASSRSAVALSLAILAAPTAAFAQSGETAAIDDPGHAPAKDQDGEAIVVTAHPPINFGLLAGTVSLEGDALLVQSRGQIGDTLSGLPGVTASSFTPGASRPILRGLDGPRVSVLIDGIGSIDASNVSADHAVVLDSLTIDHIDVIHGPGVLLFGGQAIGGAVNALDTRIPRRVPERISGTVIGGYGSAADERSAGVSLEIPLAPRLAAHFDASWRESDNLRIGGPVHSAPLRAELLAEAAELRDEGEADEAEEFEELAGLKGRIPNSGARSYTLGAGLAFIDDGGNLGISVQRYDTRYGVPLRPGTSHHHGEEEHEEGEESVSIDLVQTRVDLRGGIELGGAFDRLQVRGAYGDYRHVEFEGDEVGTVFSGEGLEFRADLIQADRNGWRGRSGVQYFTRKLDITGAEAFTPNNEIDQFGIFTLQSIALGGGFELEGAARYEHGSVRAKPVDFQRDFDLWSGAAGLSYEPAEGWKVGLNFIRGARAPSPEELLSDGLHVATQSYEVGNPGFRAETGRGGEVYLRYQGQRADFSLTGYHTRFSRFITALPTGEEIEGFPVFQYAQLPARLTGFEASGGLELMRWSEGSLRIDGSADYTRARLVDVGPVPRIPPLRLRGGAEVILSDLHLRGEVEWNDGQSRVPEGENPVPGFTFVNLSADWHPLGEEGPVTLILAANNIFNAVGRRASSFTRDFVPLHGRDIRLSAKLSF